MTKSKNEIMKRPVYTITLDEYGYDRTLVKNSDFSRSHPFHDAIDGCAELFQVNSYREKVGNQRECGT